MPRAALLRVGARGAVCVSALGCLHTAPQARFDVPLEADKRRLHKRSREGYPRRALTCRLKQISDAFTNDPARDTRGARA